MSYIDDIINEVAQKTPKFGFNVCLFDEYGDEKLIVLEHFDNRIDAEEYADDFEGETIYIYGNDESTESMVEPEDDYSWQYKDDNVKGWWNNADHKTVEEITGFSYKPYDQLSQNEKQQVDQIYGNETVRISAEATGLSRNWDEDDKKIPMGYQLEDDYDEDTGFTKTDPYEQMKNQKNTLDKTDHNQYDKTSYDWQKGGEILDLSVPKNHNTKRYIRMATNDYNKGINRDNDEYEKTNYSQESKIKAFESSPYGIQKMLDTIVENSLNKTEKAEIVEKVTDDFNLNTLLNLVAEKLATKVGKKLGVESKATEELIMRQRCPVCKIEYITQEEVFDHMIMEHGATNFKDVEQQQHNEGYNKETGYMECEKCEAKFSPNDDWQMSNYNKHMRTHTAKEYKPEDCPHCNGTGKDPDGDCLVCYGTGKIDTDDKTHGVEGGKGSGKHGHVPWMLGAEAEEECPVCMIVTERDNGKCILCGN